MSQSKSLGRPIVLILLATVLGLAGVYFWWNSSQTIRPNPQALRAVTLAWEANGTLENEEYAVGLDEQGQMIFGFQQAIPRYLEIRDLYPHEELAYRNLAIAWLLLYNSPLVQTPDQQKKADWGIPTDKEAVEAEAIKALKVLVEKFDSPIGSYLYAYALKTFSSGRGSQMEQVSKYYEAGQADPDHAPFWYSTADTASQLIGSNPQDDLVLGPILDQALAQLQRLAPDNLWVIRQTLSRMVATSDPGLGEYWKKHRADFEKANFSTQNFFGSETYGSYGEFTKRFEAVESAIELGNWNRIAAEVSGLVNEVNGKSPFVNDNLRLQPNPLDYLLWHFSEAVMQQAAVTDPAANSLVDVQFALAELPANFHDQQVVDFSLVDLDFDGQLDLFVLRDQSVEVYLGPLTKLSAEPYLKFPVAVGARGIQAAYLGTVADETGSGIARRFSEQAGRKPGVAHLELPQVLVWGEFGLNVFDLKWEADAGLSVREVEQHPSVSQWSIQRCFLVDHDQDADLDLVALTDHGLKLLLNRSNNTFIDASQFLEIPPDLSPIVDVQIVDWNRDVYIDLLVQSQDGSLGILENRRHGAFSYRPLGLPSPPNGRGFAIAEVDGNASWDVIYQQGIQTKVQFSETKSWGRVEWIGSGSNRDQAAAALSLNGEIIGPWQVGDFDNSGSQDFLLWKDGHLHFSPSQWQGTPLAIGARRIQVGTATSSVKLPAKPERGERGDFDGDGDLDVLVLADGKLSLLVNEGGNQNNWLTVVPMGRGDNVSRTNHLGIGSLFETRVGHIYNAETITRPAVHVGLGKAERPNLTRIVWTNGVPQVLLLPAGRQKIEFICILKGSCPFVYAWDGKQWNFFSDCLWAAPIGLQAPTGGLVPTRNWEYLRLPPDALAETDGTYRIMLTEELWEVAYFDYARLEVIDHPETIEVHINDKVGPPGIVQHRLYQVGEKRAPRMAVDQTERDVLPFIEREDQTFLKSFQQRVTQGYVEPHDLILDFDLDGMSQPTLFLTGWIQPTDTSINVMLQQCPDLSGPVFPALMVIGEDGQWQPAARPLGFPGGKTKTMAVPLDGLFPTSDQRLKIVTSNEIYWDHVYVADTLDQEALVQQEAKLVSAKSFFRGTARRFHARENGPELFDASDLSLSSVWPPVAGRLPAYGDVLERLQQPDDRMVVLGTGDAVELRFKIPEHPTPPGYRRTFLLYTVGYDKDADLHTLEGQQVGPLPFAAMSVYPEFQNSAPTDDLESGRQQSWYRFWKQVQNPHVVHSVTEPKVPLANPVRETNESEKVYAESF